MGFKLNLASGTDIRDGWVNLDIVPKWPLARRGCDVIWDARTDPIPFKDGTVDEVYAGYLLLHLAPRYHKSILSEIRRVMSSEAILIIGEVDMDIVMRMYLQNPMDIRFSELIWGEQGIIHGDVLADFDKHCQGFTEHSLIHLLQLNGFNDIERVKLWNDNVFYELTIKCRRA